MVDLLLEHLKTPKPAYPVDPVDPVDPVNDVLPILFALEMSTAFFICTCCLVLATIATSRIKPIYVRFISENIFSKSFYKKNFFHNFAQDFVYHLIGAFLLFGAAATLFTKMLDDKYAEISTGSFKIAAVRLHYLMRVN